VNIKKFYKKIIRYPLDAKGIFLYDDVNRMIS